jgi:hypothetical protein
MKIDTSRKASSVYRFWLNDPEGDGLTYYRTKEDRDAEAERVIDTYLDDGWSEEVEWVVGGEVTHVAAIKTKRKRPDDLDEENMDGEGTYWGDFEWMGNYHFEHLGIELSQRAEDIHELQRELAEYKVLYDHASSAASCCEEALAASQAREKVLRSSLEYYMANGVDEHLYYTVKKALSQPTDDTTLTMLLAKEFSKGYSRGFANYEEGVKLALAAERERCASVCLDIVDGQQYAEAIRALDN